jgi:hypothetical protein
VEYSKWKDCREHWKEGIQIRYVVLEGKDGRIFKKGREGEKTIENQRKGRKSEKKNRGW